MLFNSLAFLLFFAAVFFIYWFVVNKNLRLQNIMLVIASYFFYCTWDWRFGFLLAFSTLLDYACALVMHNSSRKKLWLYISVVTNLGFLFFFKYFNFFADSAATFLNMLGFKADYAVLNIVLPVGISFYTFHGLSYIFDVYNGKMQPERNLADYALFVSFFPLLVAGPIERATHLLPQVKVKRHFSYENAVYGMRQILWGYFKKMVIADNCGLIVNAIFNNHEGLHGNVLAIGAILFAFQIYGDFSGYTDIAIGTGRLLGFNLLKNFNYPYFSRNIAEFWRRWHISLSTWFKDYLFIPLGGSRAGRAKTIRNIFIVFVVSGLWHGANWTFIAWGAIHAMLYVFLLLGGAAADYKTNDTASLKDIFNMLITFFAVTIAWIFFRADSIGQAFGYLSGMFSASFFEAPNFYDRKMLARVVLLVAAFVVTEWRGRRYDFALEGIARYKKPYRWVVYAVIVFLILNYMETDTTPFIYFKF